MRLSLYLSALIVAMACNAQSAYEITADRFFELKVDGLLNVDCIHNPDSAGIVRISASDQSQLSWVEAKSGGDKLQLRLVLPDDVRDGSKPIPTDLPRVRVYSNYLTKVENDGDSTVRVLTAADVPEFSARLIGNGRLSIRGINAEKVKATLFSGRGIIVLNGTAGHATYNLTGVGTIEADGLTCEEARVRLTGTGAIGVHATKTLTISGSGSGTIYSRGAPEVKKKLALGLKFQPID